MLGQGADNVDHASVEQFEVARIARDADARNAVQKFIIRFCRNFFESAFALARQPPAVHDVIPFFPLDEHLFDHFNGILQIHVQLDGAVSRTMAEPAEDRRLLPEIAGKRKHFYPLILCRESSQQLARPVAAAVVHENDLKRVPALPHCFKYGNGSIVKRFDRRFFIITRHDDAQLFHLFPLRAAERLLDARMPALLRMFRSRAV